jgi:tetratricopeptide (TPR) repeat protein
MKWARSLSMPDKVMEVAVDTKRQIQSLLNEAELYRSQALFVEAKETYNRLAALIQENDQITNRQSLLDAISRKISAVEIEIKKRKGPRPVPEMSTKVQDLVKNLFSLSEHNDKDVAKLDGAIALAKFGQFERALIELNELIKKDSLRVVAAKNIIRCYVALSSLDGAVTKYRQWLSSDIFSSGQLEKVRIFLQDILDRRGIGETLPSVIEPTDAAEQDETSEEELLEISSIAITLDDEVEKGTLVELDVHFQRGNMIGLIIPAKHKKLVANLKVGDRLNDIQFYSPIAVFEGSGIISGKDQIKVGPRQGDYKLDIKIEST